ncbi:MAG: glutamine ABC transporter ATP-binding protein [Chloroflexota bacterium]|nr:MAG: glutamine ABC transporter ATP-binding protein [Chloroflexota bacterium]
MDKDPVIKLRNIHKSFGDLHVLKGIDLDVHHGEVLVIIGPSGCGKSTLLRCINLLEKPDDGKIIFEGKNILEPGIDINQVRTRLGIVFQGFNLFPHMTVIENVMLGPKESLGFSKEKARNIAEKQLAHVGLIEKADAFPVQLSGGQQQRVAIARSLGMAPRAILLDEITSALDPETIGEVLSVMKDLASEGTTMVVVSHEMGFAREVAHRVVFIDGGLIVEEGPPQRIFDEPQNERTRNFISMIL